MSAKYVPCLVCDPEMRCQPEIKFLHPAHHGTHDISKPQDHESYLSWVAETYDLDPEHEVFEPGGLTIPDRFEEFRHLFE